MVRCDAQFSDENKWCLRLKLQTNRGGLSFMSIMVPWSGVEPERVSPLPPQDSVSTNSTTRASKSLKRSNSIRVLPIKSMEKFGNYRLAFHYPNTGYFSISPLI